VTFRIYYDVDDIYDSEAGGDMRARGVQIITQTHPEVGWHTQSKYDFYLWRDERWVGMDRAGLFDELEERGIARFNVGIHHLVWWENEWKEVDEYGLYRWLEEMGICLFGRTLTRKSYDRIMRKALADLGDKKLGWLPDEDRITD